jgi:hypothetical protein
MRRFLWSLLALVVLAAAGVLGYHFSKSSPTTTTTHATTTTVPVAIAPLTGLADPSGLSQTRPALTVKIENTPEAMPQRGIDHADVIYEEIVEGCITRLAAVFNSSAPTQIGPIRSVRRTDREIVWPLGGLFAYSGGAPYAVHSIETAPVKTINETSAGSAMFRDNNGRVAPNNLYGVGPKLFGFHAHPVPPPALFRYRSASDPVLGTPVTSFHIGFAGGYAVSYRWNPATLGWDRTMFNQPDVTVDGTRLSPKNVVVMTVHYLGQVCEIGAEADLVGSGKVQVFSASKRISGTWKRSSISQVTSYYDSKGNVIKLTPGQTWVELIWSGDPVTVQSPASSTTTTVTTSTK